MLNEVFEIIDDIQMTDNTWQEADAAKRELKERIKKLFISKSGWLPIESAPIVVITSIIFVVVVSFSLLIFRDHEYQQKSQKNGFGITGMTENTRYSTGFGREEKIIIGHNAQSRYQRTIVIGDGAQADKNYQIVIVFTDGTKWSHNLPKGKWVNLSPTYFQPSL